MIKNLKNIESVVMKLENFRRKWLTVSDRSIEENRVWSDYSLAKLECGRIIHWFSDKWVGFWQFLLRGNFAVSQGYS